MEHRAAGLAQPQARSRALMEGLAARALMEGLAARRGNKPSHMVWHSPKLALALLEKRDFTKVHNRRKMLLQRLCL